MRKRLLAAAGFVVLLVLAAGFLARSWLQSSGFRSTLEAQASSALGVPVRIAEAQAALWPRLGVELLDVTAGDPPHARVERVTVATGLSVLWTRRVEDADVQLTGARIDTASLTGLAGAAASLSGPAEPAPARDAPVTIVSVRSIRLRDVVVTVNGRDVPIDLDASLDGDRLALTDVRATIDNAAIRLTGEIASLARREAHVDVRADELPVTALIALVTDLSPSATTGGTDAQRTPSTSFRVTASLEAPVAILGNRPAEAFAARLEATPAGLIVDPVSFTTDEGRVEMRLAYDPMEPNALVDARGRVSGLDIARLQAGTNTDRVTGTLDATFALRTPPAADPLAMLDRARGSVDLDIRNGRMPGIEIVRQAVLRFANRAGPPPDLQSSDAFSRLDAALSLQPGAARITRLMLAAADLDVEGTGTLSARDWGVALDVTVTLSETLSQQAGRDLYRFARDGRRIVLPAIIGGTLFRPTVTIDIGRAAGRALRNRVEDEVQSVFERLIKKRPRD
jgi:uncharacterized protein involved in outer membrane biogenesis